MSNFFVAPPGFVHSVVDRAQREWHLHSGWAEHGSGSKRIVNINLDALDYQRSDGPLPSVGLLTLLQDQIDPISGALFGVSALSEWLNRQHDDLKGLLRETITDEMAGRIGLNL